MTGRKAVIRVLSLFCLCLLLISGTGQVQAAEDPTKAKKAILEVFEYIKQSHLSQPESDQLMEGAIQGMVDSLGDPYTSYLTEEDLQQLTEDLDGEFGGVGIYLEAMPDYPKVQEIFPDSPALKAGVKVGDRIKKVNGENIRGLSLPAAVEKIKGPVGSQVVLVIDRAGVELNVTLKRALLNVPTVESRVINGKTGYIAVKSFGLKTPDQFSAALQKLVDQNIGGLVIDLRDNPGGYLNAALEMAEIFLDPNSTIVNTKNYDGSENRYLSERQGKPVKTPLVILANSLSASSSEIMIGALKDNGVASLVGEQTYGKGTAQSLIKLKTGGALKITTTEYTTPRGLEVNQKGIQPDYEVITRDLQLPFALRLLDRGPGQIVFITGSDEVDIGGELVRSRSIPIINDSSTYLPLRFTMEALGYVVSWEETSQSIVARKKDSRLIIPPAGNPSLNGAEISLEGGVLIREGVSFISLSLIEKMGYSANQAEGRITIKG